MSSGSSLKISCFISGLTSIFCSPCSILSSFCPVKTDNEFAFIGLAGIKDYGVFWNALESNQNTIGGEIKISNGLTSLVERGLYAKTFTWFDVGTPNSYAHAVRNYPNGTPYRGE